MLGTDDNGNCIDCGLPLDQCICEEPDNYEPLAFDEVDDYEDYDYDPYEGYEEDPYPDEYDDLPF